jgi:hypothetical protein
MFEVVGPYEMRERWEEIAELPEDCVLLETRLTGILQRQRRLRLQLRRRIRRIHSNPAKAAKKKINPVIPVPKKVPLFIAAISEPFACALHAHKKLVRPGRWDKSLAKYNFIQGITDGDVVVGLVEDPWDACTPS